MEFLVAPSNSEAMDLTLADARAWNAEARPTNPQPPTAGM